MKRILMLVATVFLLAAPAMAQAIRINASGVTKKTEKSDADIQDPKKNEKSATWINRGKAYYDAAVEATQALYQGLSQEELELYYGKANSQKQTAIDGLDFEILEYPYFSGYFHDGMLYFWNETQIIVPGALDTAFESYRKAYEIDSKSASKVKAGLTDVANRYKQNGENQRLLRQFKQAGDSFRAAYEAQKHPAVGVIDGEAIYNAGFYYTISRDFTDGLAALQEAEAQGYYSDGDTYDFIFHAYFGLEQTDKAREALFKGLAAYPSNTRIIEDLIGFYLETKQDPSEIVTVVESSIQQDPDNGTLWRGLGTIYDKLGEQDKAIEALTKAVALLPEDFNANFSLGLTYINQGDAINAEIQGSATSQAEYNAGIERVYEKYENSLPWLEKAHNMMPTEPITVELLKNVTFRLRDRSDEMMSKYQSYDALLKQLKGE